jgi:hypothetical protein
VYPDHSPLMPNDHGRWPFWPMQCTDASRLSPSHALADALAQVRAPVVTH